MPQEQAADQGPIIKGRIGTRPREVRRLPRRGCVKRYVLTSAQNNTHVHEAVWLNVLAMASHYGAEVMVGTLKYDRSSHNRGAKRGSERYSKQEWWDPAVTEHIVDRQVQLAPGLVWCGELQVIPTARDPLSLLESYNGRESNILPHVQHAMTSVASLGDEATKFNYTTGTVTQRNYIQMKAGITAERYHGYGALLVEVLGDGSWFVRQLEAAADGSIRDFDLKAQDGEVSAGHPVECVTWGDVHVRVIEPSVRALAWAPGGMLDCLRPRMQVLHDVIDFRSRNHHEAKDPLALFDKWQAGAECVATEVAESAYFMTDEASRPWCETFVAPSNHHEAFCRWLKEADWRRDPVNAHIYHEAWLWLLDGETDVYRRACQAAGIDPTVRFLETDESLVICKDVDGVGIEVGMHGHLGLNGARGNSRAFAKLGRKCSIGHMHSAGIYLGVWTAGTSSRLRIGYNRGPSSWSWSHVVHYPEGTRTMVTMWKGRWRA